MARYELPEGAAEKIDRLLAALAAGGADHNALAQAATALADAEARLSRAEERWLTLSDELGG